MIFNQFKVIEIIDGCSFKVNPKWMRYNRSDNKVKIADFKAPAMNEPGGLVAKSRLQSLIMGKNVSLDPKDVDRDGFLIADVVVEGRSIAHQL